MKWSSALLVWLAAMILIGDVGARLFFPQSEKAYDPLGKYRNYYLSMRNPEVLVLGSSAALIPNLNCDKQKFALTIKAQDYFDARYLAQTLRQKTGRSIDTANLATNGSMVSDAWLIAQKSVEFGKTPKLIIYEMTSRDFFDASMPELGRTPVFSTVSSLHPKSSNAFLPEQIVQFMDWAWSSPLATAISTMLLDTKFLTDDERFRTTFDSIACAVCYSYKQRGDLRKWLTNGACELLNRPSSVYESSRKALEERKKRDPFGSLSVAKTGSIEVDSRPQEKRFNDEFLFFERLLGLCKKEGIALIVIDMPMGETYAAKVPPALRERYPSLIVSMCKNYGAFYLDFNRPGWFEAKDFRDSIHLSETGSLRFTALVAEQLFKHGLIGSSNSNSRQ